MRYIYNTFKGVPVGSEEATTSNADISKLRLIENVMRIKMSAEQRVSLIEQILHGVDI